MRPGEYLRVMARFHAHPLDPADLLDRLGLSRVGQDAVQAPVRGPAAAAVPGRCRHRPPRNWCSSIEAPRQGLDPQARHATWDLIGGLRASGATVILPTHYMDEAERLADWVAIVDHGRLVAEGTTADLTGTAGQLRFRAEPGGRLARRRRRPDRCDALPRRHHAQHRDHRPDGRIRRRSAGPERPRGSRRL